MGLYSNFILVNLFFRLIHPLYSITICIYTTKCGVYLIKKAFNCFTTPLLPKTATLMKIEIISDNQNEKY